ncbi:MAG: polysaccharide deacetylase family protein [Bacteroidota bacterium]|nr:polysaccharide deacetylase family protein [Bacteroidota bacterium]
MISHTGRLHQFLFPSLVWKISSPHIFLTFDDGPHPEATPAVMKVLSRYQIPATFFLSGKNIADNRSLVHDMNEQRHTIGSHGYHHSRASFLTLQNSTKEIVKTEKEIASVVPLHSRLFRPPYGFFTWSTIRAARALRYELVMWTALTGDFRSWSDERIIANTVKKLSSGSILVFHDNEQTKKKIASLLTQCIERIRDRGFSFSAIGHDND